MTQWFNTIESGWQAATIGLAVAAGISSGTTFAFSTFVMHGLSRLPEADAIRAMQQINITAISPLFLLVLLGTAPAVIALAVARSLGGNGDPLLWLAAALYFAGVVVVTGAGNVPLNDALARVPADVAPAGTWAEYAHPWLRYNHLRTAVAAAVSALLVLAARG